MIGRTSRSRRLAPPSPASPATLCRVTAIPRSAKQILTPRLLTSFRSRVSDKWNSRKLSPYSRVTLLAQTTVLYRLFASFPLVFFSVLLALLKFSRQSYPYLFKLSTLNAAPMRHQCVVGVDEGLYITILFGTSNTMSSKNCLGDSRIVRFWLTVRRPFV